MDSIKSFQPYMPASELDRTPSAAVSKEPKSSPEAKDQVSLSGGTEQKLPDPIKPHKKWLFMNYIAADCNLTDFQLKNIDQQEQVGSDANTHIVAYVDVGDQKNIMGDWKDCRTYYVTKDDTKDQLNSEVIQEFGKTNMADPATLTKFIVDAMGKFPSDYVCLVLNDHGGGFTGAMSDDGAKAGAMSMPDMKKALSDAEKITGKKIDVLGFDACLMAETEVAYELKDHANILMASEETENGPGWAYHTLLSGSNMAKAIETVQQSSLYKIDVGPEEFAKIVVDVNKENNADIPTFSVTDLTQMDAFKDSLNELASSIQKSEEKETIKQAIQNAEYYGQGWAPYGDIRDVGHMVDNIISTAKDKELVSSAKKVKAQLAKTVMYNQVNEKEHPQSQGLSIYAPTNKPNDLGYNYEQLQFAKDTQWDEMLKELGIGSAQSEETPKVPDVWPDGSKRI